MKLLFNVSFALAAIASAALAIPLDQPVRSEPNLVVDLGYSVYQGVTNNATGLNTWLGIRFAAPPTGNLRWQAPAFPDRNRTEIIQANALPPRCPQTESSPGSPADLTGDEDCLFLSVYAPPNAKNLPVMLWIHGGGYGQGQGNQDPSALINANNNGFIGIAIQYRLGAFGFLSSADVQTHGVVNAGLLDQAFALDWVQRHITLFGGNPSQVTIGGESAGGGSVMLQSMAFGGTIKNTLFSNVIAASPYLPPQYFYNDAVPTNNYNAFAKAAGCGDTGTFACLVAQDSATLLNASNAVSTSGQFGTWAFVPVTDGDFVRQLPSVQLLAKEVNGARTLIGNNANEGTPFNPTNVTTEADFVAYVKFRFPEFTEPDIAEVLLQYPSNGQPTDPTAIRFATAGDSGPTANSVSSYATGQQQRADNVYAEVTFVCPAYWLAQGFSGPGHAAYRYQHSVPGSIHGDDIAAEFGPEPVNFGPDYEKAFMTIWGNFIINNNPSIPNAIANGATSGSVAFNPASDWPTYSFSTPHMIDLNQTGGVPMQEPSDGIEITETVGPTLRNNIRLVDATSWEGGRGLRCEFWKRLGAKIPA